MSTPGEEHWKEMVAQLALRTGMSPYDVEAATEGRIKAAEATDLMTRAAGSEESTPPAADGAPPEQSVPADESSENAS